MKYSLMQKVFTAETYVRKKSYKKCRDKFRRRFPGVSLPSKKTIYRLVNTFIGTGSLLEKKRGRSRLVLSEETLDDTGALFEANSRKCV
jgi:hypothetical protein